MRSCARSGPRSCRRRTRRRTLSSRVSRPSGERSTRPSNALAAVCAFPPAPWSPMRRDSRARPLSTGPSLSSAIDGTRLGRALVRAPLRRRAGPLPRSGQLHGSLSHGTFTREIDRVPQAPRRAQALRPAARSAGGGTGRLTPRTSDARVWLHPYRLPDPGGGRVSASLCHPARSAMGGRLGVSFRVRVPPARDLVVGVRPSMYHKVWSR